VRVASLDENFMVVRRSANLSVSQDLKGFHFYGTDLCVSPISWATPATFVDFHLWHIGGESQPKKSRDQAFRSDYHPSKKALYREIPARLRAQMDTEYRDSPFCFWFPCIELYCELEGIPVLGQEVSSSAALRGKMPLP